MRRATLVITAGQAHAGGASAGQTGREIADFLIDRLKVQQRDAGVRHDMIDAVVAVGGEDDRSHGRRVNALQQFVETQEGADLLTAYKRAANILKKENWTGPRDELGG